MSASGLGLVALTDSVTECECEYKGRTAQQDCSKCGIEVAAMRLTWADKSEGVLGCGMATDLSICVDNE